MSATYPNGIVAWTPRVDFTDIVWAADPNSLASEIMALETYVGTQPQNEASPPTGSTVNYATMSARLSAANNNALLPFCYLVNTTRNYCKAGAQQYNSYGSNVDPYGMYNGNDITIPCDGYWIVRTQQRWNCLGYDVDGWNFHFLYLNNNWLDFHWWQWDLPPSNVFPTNILGSYGWNSVTWAGLLHQGDRLQTLACNATQLNPFLTDFTAMTAVCVRTLDGITFTSE